MTNGYPSSNRNLFFIHCHTQIVQHVIIVASTKIPYCLVNIYKRMCQIYENNNVYLAIFFSKYLLRIYMTFLMLPLQVHASQKNFIMSEIYRHADIDRKVERIWLSNAVLLCDGSLANSSLVGQYQIVRFVYRMWVIKLSQCPHAWKAVVGHIIAAVSVWFLHRMCIVYLWIEIYIHRHYN